MSNFGGGGDRSWLVPLTPEGNKPTDSNVPHKVVGSHTGHYTGLNVVNPQPGFEYQWARNNGNEIHAARIRGWRVVNDSDPEMAALRANLYGDEDSDTPTQLDTSDVFQDVVFMKIPSAKLRVIREEQLKANREMLQSGAAQAFLREDSGDSMGKPTRFVQRHHGVQYQGGGEVEEQWSPDQGIIQE